MNQDTQRQIEERIVAAERDLHSIRAMLAVATRCSCPPGFGSQSDANCPKHGGARVEIAPTTEPPHVEPMAPYVAPQLDTAPISKAVEEHVLVLLENSVLMPGQVARAAGQIAAEAALTEHRRVTRS